MARLILLVAVYAVAGLGAAVALFVPAWQRTSLAVAIGALEGLAVAELFRVRFERFVGLRYLKRQLGERRKRRGRTVGLVVSLAVMGVGALCFRSFHGTNRTAETVAVVLILAAALTATVFGLLHVFSVFTTVSAMGVLLGVQSLVVVLGVTSGFEREFQDKVLALNAHLIVIPYGNVDIDSPEADHIQSKLRGLPGVTRMAKFLFSAGEVMVGRVGANLKGIDLDQGADDLRRALVEGSVEDLRRPASCPAMVPGGAPSDAGRIALGAELAHRLRLKIGDCVPIMVPFSEAGDITPPSFLFRVVGIFRMGFNEYDTRLAYISLQDARRLSSVRQSVFGVELRFSDPRQALGMANEVKRRLDGAYRVIDWKDLNHNLFMALTMQKVIISLLLVLITLVAAFNILASLTLIVLSKGREIAILKAMGADAPRVARVFLVAGTAVGSVGIGFGILLGLLVCGLAQLYGYPLDPKVYLIAELPVSVAGYEIVAVAALTLLVCVLATVYPALRASRLETVEGLRYS
jgi:lipoprotein-releasing system permease protein